VLNDRLQGWEASPGLVDLLGDHEERLAAAGERAGRDPGEVVALAEVVRLAPVPRPPALRDCYAFEAQVLTRWGARGLVVEPAWYRDPASTSALPTWWWATGPR